MRISVEIRRDCTPDQPRDGPLGLAHCEKNLADTSRAVRGGRIEHGTLDDGCRV